MSVRCTARRCYVFLVLPVLSLGLLAGSYWLIVAIFAEDNVLTGLIIGSVAIMQATLLKQAKHTLKQVVQKQ